MSRYSLSNSTSDAFGPAGSQHGDEMNLLAVASVHGHPNGEILQAIHNHVVSYPYPIIFDSEWYERLRRLLTRKQVNLILVNDDIPGFPDYHTEMARQSLFNTNKTI